jgi:hypothetical protein
MNLSNFIFELHNQKTFSHDKYNLVFANYFTTCSFSKLVSEKQTDKHQKGYNS